MQYDCNVKTMTWSLMTEQILGFKTLKGLKLNVGTHRVAVIY